MTIWILILAVIIGLVAGVIRRGDFPTILNTQIYHPEFLVSSAICAFFVSVTDIDSDGVIAFVALVGAFAFTIMNLHLVGMVILSIGLALNLFVLILNFETPVRPNALVEAEIVTAAELERGVTISGHVELADDDSVLDFLGDTFPIRWSEQVVSIGDLIFLVGLANVTGNLMLGNQRRRYTYGQFLQSDESTDADPEDEEPPSEFEMDLDTPESPTVYPEAHDEYYESPTVYPESAPVYPESAPTALQPLDPWSEPPWNPSP
ncbi:MAG: hypothetical protein F4125_07840 [Acidimicrobiaceae bacterium]|nr:hypothetical protein [Acidimicrobiaceae bacterium]